MKNRRFVLFLTILLIIVSLFGYRNNWWCIPSAGYIESPEDGASAGQTAIGDVLAGHSLDEGTYGFWHEAMLPTICFEIDHDTWELDTIDVLETVTMEDEDGFIITNCGNCHLGFGLRIVSSAPLLWEHGYIADINKYVMRAQFTEEAIAPDTYDIVRDYIKDVINWASDDNFGPGGYDFAYSEPHHLFLQFQGPSHSDTWDANTITIELTARANLF